MNGGINIPGSPGTAMALAAGVSVYSASRVADNFQIILFIVVTIIFIAATCYIESMHIKSKEKIEEMKKS